MQGRRFVKKPAVIEAVRYDGENKLEICGFLGNTKFDAMFDDERMAIHTLEGVMTVSPGDWVIKGIKGEFYPIKPDVFLESYQEVLNIETADLTDEEKALLDEC